MPLDQLDAHLLGQEGVLEVGRIARPWRQHHHGGVFHVAGVAQGIEQQGRVVRHRRHRVAGKQLGKQPHHHLAVFQHVAHPRGHAQVVFEHVVAAVRMADQIDPGDVRVNAVRQVQALHGGLVLGVGKHLFGGNEPGFDDVVVVVDVPQKAVQRRHPLAQARLQHLPLVGMHDARHGVKRNQALGPGLVAIHRKGDADPVEQQIGFRVFFGQRLGRLRVQPVGKGLVMRSDGATGQQHLVVMVRSG